MNVVITPGTGASSVAAEVIATLNYQQIKVIDGTPSSTTPLKVNADGSITASIYGNISVSPPANQSVSGTVVTITQGSVAAVIIGGSIAASFTPPANQSVSGTVGASIIGTVPVTGAVSFSNASVLTAYAPSASLVSGVTSVITTTSITAVMPSAPGAQRNYITQITATNAAATGTFVDILDGTTVIFSGYAAASGGGFAASFPAPLRQSSVSAVLDMQTSAQASVKVAISGFTAA